MRDFELFIHEHSKKLFVIEENSETRVIQLEEGQTQIKVYAKVNKIIGHQQYGWSDSMLVLVVGLDDDLTSMHRMSEASLLQPLEEGGGSIQYHYQWMRWGIAGGAEIPSVEVV
jgi:hypothetical protein